MPGASEFGAAVGKTPPRETEHWKSLPQMTVRLQF